jgi:hypothetical protein
MAGGKDGIDRKGVRVQLALKPDALNPAPRLRFGQVKRPLRGRELRLGLEGTEAADLHNPLVSANSGGDLCIAGRWRCR